jgi:hypothetical protein
VFEGVDGGGDIGGEGEGQVFMQETRIEGVYELDIGTERFLRL